MNKLSPRGFRPLLRTYACPNTKLGDIEAFGDILGAFYKTVTDTTDFTELDKVTALHDTIERSEEHVRRCLQKAPMYWKEIYSRIDSATVTNRPVAMMPSSKGSLISHNFGLKLITCLSIVHVIKSSVEVDGMLSTSVYDTINGAVTVVKSADGKKITARNNLTASTTGILKDILDEVDDFHKSVSEMGSFIQTKHLDVDKFLKTMGKLDGCKESIDMTFLLQELPFEVRILSHVSSLANLIDAFVNSKSSSRLRRNFLTENTEYQVPVSVFAKSEQADSFSLPNLLIQASSKELVNDFSFALVGKSSEFDSSKIFTSHADGSGWAEGCLAYLFDTYIVSQFQAVMKVLMYLRAYSKSASLLKLYYSYRVNCAIHSKEAVTEPLGEALRDEEFILYVLTNFKPSDLTLGTSRTIDIDYFKYTVEELKSLDPKFSICKEVAHNVEKMFLKWYKPDNRGIFTGFVPTYTTEALDEKSHIIRLSYSNKLVDQSTGYIYNFETRVSDDNKGNDFTRFGKEKLLFPEIDTNVPWDGGSYRGTVSSNRKIHFDDGFERTSCRKKNICSSYGLVIDGLSEDEFDVLKHMCSFKGLNFAFEYNIPLASCQLTIVNELAYICPASKGANTFKLGNKDGYLHCEGITEQIIQIPSIDDADVIELLLSCPQSELNEILNKDGFEGLRTKYEQQVQELCGDVEKIIAYKDVDVDCFSVTYPSITKMNMMFDGDVVLNPAVMDVTHYVRSNVTKSNLVQNRLPRLLDVKKTLTGLQFRLSYFDLSPYAISVLGKQDKIVGAFSFAKNGENHLPMFTIEGPFYDFYPVVQIGSAALSVDSQVKLINTVVDAYETIIKPELEKIGLVLDAVVRPTFKQKLKNTLSDLCTPTSQLRQEDTLIFLEDIFKFNGKMDPDTVSNSIGLVSEFLQKLGDIEAVKKVFVFSCPEEHVRTMGITYTVTFNTHMFKDKNITYLSDIALTKSDLPDVRTRKLVYNNPQIDNRPIFTNVAIGRDEIENYEDICISSEWLSILNGSSNVTDKAFDVILRSLKDCYVISRRLWVGDYNKETFSNVPFSLSVIIENLVEFANYLCTYFDAELPLHKVVNCFSSLTVKDFHLKVKNIISTLGKEIEGHSVYDSYDKPLTHLLADLYQDIVSVSKCAELGRFSVHSVMNYGKLERNMVKRLISRNFFYIQEGTVFDKILLPSGIGQYINSQAVESLSQLYASVIKNMTSGLVDDNPKLPPNLCDLGDSSKAQSLVQVISTRIGSDISEKLTQVFSVLENTDATQTANPEGQKAEKILDDQLVQIPESKSQEDVHTTEASALNEEDTKKPSVASDEGVLTEEVALTLNKDNIKEMLKSDDSDTLNVVAKVHTLISSEINNVDNTIKVIFDGVNKSDKDKVLTALQSTFDCISSTDNTILLSKK